MRIDLGIQTIAASNTSNAGSICLSPVLLFVAPLYTLATWPTSLFCIDVEEHAAFSFVYLGQLLSPFELALELFWGHVFQIEYLVGAVLQALKPAGEVLGIRLRQGMARLS